MESGVQEGYNQWAATYDSVVNKTRDADERATQTVLATIALNKILECGCGTGKNTAWLAQKGSSLTAMDFSEAMLQKAAEKVASPNVTFVQADLTQRWPFEREAFDAITSNLVLEHIENLPHVFKEAARVLKTGGYFFVSELHPVKQYSGSKARFEKDGETHVLPCFVHHASHYFSAATSAGLQCQRLDEWFDEGEAIPRLISFLFQKFKVPFTKTESG